jgi:hypothetical protein
MAATVMGDAAVSTGGQKFHLVFPGVRTERPTVTKDDRLSGSPILVVEINVAGAFFADRDVGHCVSFFWIWFVVRAAHWLDRPEPGEDLNGRALSSKLVRSLAP